MKSASFLASLPGALFLLFSAQLAYAGSYYLQGNMTTANGQTIGLTTVWFDQASGGGNNPTTFAGHDFFANGFDIRTGTSTSTFGDAFTTLHLNDTFGIRTLGASVISIANVITSGVNARINAGANGVANATFGALVNNVSTLLDSVDVNRTVNLGVTTLTGTGGFSIRGGGGIRLSAANATGFTGNIGWGDASNTVLNFENDLVSGGGLIALATSRIQLDQNVSFSAVTLNGSTLSAGTYSYSYLNTNFDSIFLEGGSGSITVVPEPGVFVLFGLGLLLLVCRNSRNRVARLAECECATN